MADLVITVPKNLWRDWIAEGDLPGDAESGSGYAFYVAHRPPIDRGDRLYVVAWDRLRGYAPVVRVDRIDRRFAIIRRGGAVAVTINESIKGFRGWRKIWWGRTDEYPFPNWRMEGVGDG